MKKLILAFLMASVSCVAQNIKVATTSNPSQNIISGVTINNSTNLVVPGTLTVSGLSTFNGNFTGIGADYLLNSQTLTGNGSVLTRSLGDARYSPIGGVTTNSNVFADNSTNSFYDLIVRNTFQQTGAAASNLFLGVTTISNAFNVVGAITGTAAVQGTVFNGTSTVVSSTFGRGITVTNSTTATVIVRTTGKAEAQLNVGNDASLILSTNGVQVSRFGNVTAVNSPFTGLALGDTYMAAIGANRVAIGANSILGYTFNGSNHIFPAGDLTISNNFQVVGNSTFKNGFTGVVTNTIGPVTNIMAFGSGILTNLTRIP